MKDKFVALVIISAGIALALLADDEAWALLAATAVVPLVVVGALVALGHAILRQRPIVGGWMIEAITLLRWWLGAAATAFLLWLAITQAPGDQASPREKTAWAAASAALGALVTAWLVEPAKEEEWNLLKKATKRTFGGQFRVANYDPPLTGDSDRIREDAMHALVDDPPSLNAKDIHISPGWSWTSRRGRMTLIEKAIKAHLWREQVGA